MSQEKLRNYLRRQATQKPTHHGLSQPDLEGRISHKPVHGTLIELKARTEEQDQREFRKMSISPRRPDFWRGVYSTILQRMKSILPQDHEEENLTHRKMYY